jgi:hypothetical protein
MPDPPSGRAISWGGFQALRPDLATIGGERFYEFGSGLGFLATVRADGGPRVHPISPVLTDDALFALIVPGPKLADLRRDGRFALHSETFPPPRADDAFYITGTAYEVGDRDAWDRVAAQLLAEREGMTPWHGFETQVLFEFKLDRCLLTLTRGSNTFPAGHTIWHVP